jgi:hypothetical protein
MDEETKKRIADFFDAGELAEYLGVTSLDIIEAFPVEVEDALEEINELMEYHNE